jgi:hypothetical protein
MPTGYTEKLCDEDQSFEEFVWRCARAMGGMIHMRDDPLDAPLKRPSSSFDSIEHHQKGIEKAEKEIGRIQQLTDKQVAWELKSENDLLLKEHEKSVASVTAVRERLLRMRSQVADWQPPENGEFEGFKKFMLQQLDETIKWDGDVPDPPTIKTDVEEWRRERIKSSKWSLNYHTEHLAKGQERHKSRVDWMKQLEASVAIPPSLGPVG